MTKIFSVANKHFMQFAVAKVNRDWRYKIVFRFNYIPMAKITAHFNFLMK